MKLLTNTAHIQIDSRSHIGGEGSNISVPLLSRTQELVAVPTMPNPSTQLKIAMVENAYSLDESASLLYATSPLSGETRAGQVIAAIKIHMKKPQYNNN